MALSYTWGDHRSDSLSIWTIVLPRLRENLSLALQHFEQEELALRIWIDSICINQNDKEEMTQQVSMMADIFARARMVLAWLGPGESGAEKGIETLRRLGVEALPGIFGRFQGTRTIPLVGSIAKAVCSNLWSPNGFRTAYLVLTPG